MHARVERSKMGPAHDAGRAPVRPRRLRSLLLLLVLSLLLPALAASAFLIWDSSRQAIRFQERQLVATASTLSLVVDRQLSEQSGVLNALAVSRLLETGDWAGFDRQARRALAGSRSWIAVRTPDGQQLVNTLRPAGARLPHVDNPRVPPNRPPRADGVRVSNVAVGALSGAPVIVVVKAVTLQDGREVDLSVVTPTAAFSELLHRQQLPSTWIATILDGDFRVVSRSRNEARFRGTKATPIITRHLTEGASGIIWGRSLDGVATRTAFQPVENSDWTVLVAVPKQELAAPVRRALIVGGLVAVGLLLAGVALALRSAALITGDVRRLQAATAVGVGEGFVRPQGAQVMELGDLAEAFEAASEKVRQNDSTQQLLINELNRRVKNTLATLQSVITHSRRSAGNVEDFHAALEGRIMAMSGAHELLTRAAWNNADLEALARSALKPFEGPRLSISGPPVEVTPTDALNLTLIFYELATNAAKYGALSGEVGSASLSWVRDGDCVRLRWIESGGPPVAPQTRQGFGSRLLQRARATFSPSEFDHHPSGVRCSLTLRARVASAPD